MNEDASDKEVERQVKQRTLARLRKDQAAATGDVKEILEVISTRLYDGAFNVDPLVTAQLKWRFRRQLGQDPRAYVDALRLETAYHLICGSDAQVSDISASLGFQDPSRFSKWFKRRTGRSPSGLRRGEARLAAALDEPSARQAQAWQGALGRSCLLGALAHDDAAALIRSLRGQLEDPKELEDRKELE